MTPVQLSQRGRERESLDFETDLLSYSFTALHHVAIMSVQGPKEKDISKEMAEIGNCWYGHDEGTKGKLQVIMLPMAGILLETGE